MTEKILNIALLELDKMYGASIPKEFEARFAEEAEIYREHKKALSFEYRLGLIRKALKKEGYRSYPSASYGSTLISYLLGVCDNNPLPTHYYCSTCKRVELISDSALPEWDYSEKACPCGGILTPMGFDIPKETHKYFLNDPCTTLFVCKGGVKLAKELIKSNFKEYFVVEEPNKHSGKPVLVMLEDGEEQIVSEENCLYESRMHITVHDKDELDMLCDLEREYGAARLLDQGYLSYVRKSKTVKALEENGLKIPEFTTKSEYLKICAMAHGTGTWHEARGKYSIPLCDVPAFRDDVFSMLVKAGLDSHRAYTITRRVRTGWYVTKGEIFQDDLEDLEKLNLPTWFIKYIEGVSYQMAKAQGVELAKIDLSLAWYAHLQDK